jgi:hypothetical protein
MVAAGKKKSGWNQTTGFTEGAESLEAQVTAVHMSARMVSCIHLALHYSQYFFHLCLR